uniref:Uncharacterized protein n=1 Tax=Myotis myotis TaxID=51298 RepID=A0A7J7T5Z7_MYOMY|nr:hypothetical protein mMyoMyo1_009220 [Myotis myotis]
MRYACVASGLCPLMPPAQASGTRWWAPTCPGPAPVVCSCPWAPGRLFCSGCNLGVISLQPPPLPPHPVVRVPEAALHALSCDDRVASCGCRAVGAGACSFPHPEKSWSFCHPQAAAIGIGAFPS